MNFNLGLPKNHPESYHHYMWENFFSKIDILAENVHILNGNADDLKMECKKFEEEITKAGGVDLCIGGKEPFFKSLDFSLSQPKIVTKIRSLDLKNGTNFLFKLD